MREIKCRGLSGIGEWIYGSYATTNFPRRRVVIINSDGFGHVEVLPETVGQFTGLQDLNGIDIYEGDIVETSFFEDYDNECQFVESGEICAGVVEQHASGTWLAVDNSDGVWLSLYHVSDYAHTKVVGNIHENT